MRPFGDEESVREFAEVIAPLESSVQRASGCFVLAESAEDPRSSFASDDRIALAIPGDRHGPVLVGAPDLRSGGRRLGERGRVRVPVRVRLPHARLLPPRRIPPEVATSWA